MTSLSFAIDYQVWGRAPFGYHFTNLALHLANTLLGAFQINSRDISIVLILLDILWKQRRAWIEKLPFLLVSLIIGAATFVAQATGKGETLAGAEVIPIGARFGLVGFCSLFSAWKFLWPVHLSAIYPVFVEMGWRPVTAIADSLALEMGTY